MIKVYIASPYTLGDVAKNVRAQIDAYDALEQTGFAPFWPLSTHFVHMVHPKEYERWMMQDMEWLKVCDCVLRLPGESVGADREVSAALKLGIPVFYSLKSLLDARDDGTLKEQEDERMEGDKRIVLRFPAGKLLRREASSIRGKDADFRVRPLLEAVLENEFRDWLARAQLNLEDFYLVFLDGSDNERDVEKIYSIILSIYPKRDITLSVPGDDPLWKPYQYRGFEVKTGEQA